MTAFPTINKRAFEARLFGVNLAPRMRTGDTILAISAVLADDALTIDSITFTPTACAFRVSGGDPGDEFPILIQFTTMGTPTQMLEAEVRLVITQGSEITA